VRARARERDIDSRFPQSTHCLAHVLCPNDSLYPPFSLLCPPPPRPTSSSCPQAPQYNGKRGVIERWDGERFVVRIHDKEKGVKIKPENLRPCRDVSREAAGSAGEMQEEEEEHGPLEKAFTGVVRER
jgi:hypothetical protein